MKIIKHSLITLILAMFCSSVWAMGVERFVEGVHYEKVEGTEAAPGTVIEFFSIGCPHCFHLESMLDTWLKTKPKNVTFSRVPATWNPGFRDLGQLYYTARKLKLEDKLVPLAFERIHVQKKNIKGRADAEALFAELGVDEQTFADAWSDQQVETETNVANRAFAKYQIRGVPAFVVNGQYKTTAAMAGSADEVFDVINFLLTK